jgi:FkbM family methyltransferase
VNPRRVRFKRTKRKLARLLSSRSAGRIVGELTGHRVRNRGIVFDTAGWDPRIEAMLAFRIYESAEIRFVRSYLAGSLHAIELGGSLGVASSHLLRVMDPQGTLTSVEANLELIPVLQTTLLSHARGRKVDVIYAAVTELSGPRIAVDNNSLGSRLARQGIAVPALSLAAIVARANYREYVLFSDIEGSEASFIFSHGGLDRCTRMVIELHDTIHEGCNVTSDEMLAELQRAGFKLLDRYGNVCALSR